jgi:hypothetical protein
VTHRLLLLTIALLGVTAIRGTAADLVEIHINGHYYAEPATVQITVAVQPDQENRTLRVEADGASLFRSSEVALNGSDEKRIHVVEFRNLPAGNYEVRAEVLSSTAVRGTAVQDVEVTGGPR